MLVLPGITPRRWFAAAGVALAVALAGCTETTPTQDVSVGSPASSPPGSSPGSSPTGPSPDGGSDGSAQPGQPGPTDPSPPVTGGTRPPADDAFPPVTTIPGDRRHPQQWDGYTTGADGRTLTFSYYAGVEPCSTFDSIVADEGPDAVRVTIYERAGPDGVACIMLAQQKSATVTLAAPLGARTLIDGGGA